jgi:hypothetical protein
VAEKKLNDSIVVQLLGDIIGEIHMDIYRVKQRLDFVTH